MNDPVELLGPTRAELDPALKRRVLDQTLAELRRQRKKRRWRPLSALATAIAAGMLIFAIIPDPPAPRPTRPERVSEPQTAVALEWEALEKPEESHRLYLEAGKRYLEEDDPASAVRCYGGALDAGPKQHLEIDVEDDYLLMAIKLARKTESER